LRTSLRQTRNLHRVRLLVFDKGWAGEPQRYGADTIDEVLPLVQAIPPRLGPGNPPPSPTAVTIARPSPAFRPSPAA
jgi:hypothetical protein